MASARVGTPQRWAPPLLLLTLVAVVVTAMSWRLGAVGWGNQYYAAVAQSGARGEWAFIEASPDLAAVTGTDKPPLGFWPMAVAVSVFGLHGWAIALPQVLESTATVAVLALLVRRVGGSVAAATAAAALAGTPVFFVLARYDDPDTVLTLCITVAAYAAVRACEARASRRWLVLLGGALGAGFLSKWLTAAVPAPALVGAVLWFRRPVRPGGRRGLTAPVSRRTLLWVLGPATAVGLSWVVATLLVPAAHRPELDSPTDTLLDVIVTQDGVGRLATAATSGTTASVRGAVGPLRLVTAPFAGQIGWFLPVAVLACCLAVVRVRRGAAPSPAWLVLGGWLALAGAVLSFMGGALHPYYSVLIAPPAAGLAGLAADALWRRRLRLRESAAWGAAAAVGVGVPAHMPPSCSAVTRPSPWPGGSWSQRR